MFGKKKHCAICGEKVSSSALPINGGFLCPACSRLSSGSPFATVEQVKAAWYENHRRFSAFKPEIKLSNFAGGAMVIDPEQKMMYLSPKKHPKLEPVVFRFSEINTFEMKEFGQRTVTKTKGGVRRALIGGALFGRAGAIVGAATAKQETAVVGGSTFLLIDLTINGLNTSVSLYNPPAQAALYLESAMNE